MLPQRFNRPLSEKSVKGIIPSEIRKNGAGAILTLRSAVAAAKPSKKGGKAVAKRARKVKGVSLSPEDVKTIWSALVIGATQKDDKCGDACESGLAIMRAKGVK